MEMDGSEMKSYSMQVFETRGALNWRDVAIPECGPQQFRIRARAASLNRGEFILGHGLQKPGTSKAIGMEGAGEVTEVGPEVTGFKVGDRVFGRCPGAFSEFAVMDVREAIPMPANLSFEEAASIPLTFLVVHDMLVTQGKLQPNEWLLVTGVSSGVGVAALQAAKAMGAKVIGTSGSQEKLDRLKKEGLDLGICTREPNFAEAVMKATDNKGVNLVVNTVGGTVFAETIKCLAFEGRHATVGYVDNSLSAQIDLQALHVNRLTLFGVSNKKRTPEQRSAGVPAFVRDFMPYFASGKIKPLIDRVFPFEQLPEAKAYMESNQHLGKIVLKGPSPQPSPKGEGGR
jgi:NADPH2:quinone reductase